MVRFDWSGFTTMVQFFYTLLQFFNPGAFAPVNTFPQGLPGINATEPQDDAVRLYTVY